MLLPSHPKSEWALFTEMLAPSAGERILDIGAGNGIKTSRLMLASKDVEVYAVDPNPRRVDLIRKKFPAIKSSVSPAERLPFTNSFFDKAYAMMSLHHFEDIDAALRETARVLKPHGVFVVVEVDSRSLKGRLFRFVGTLMGEKMILRTKEQLEDGLGGTGLFSIVRSERQRSGVVLALQRN